MILTHIGAFSIEKGNRSSVESLQYAVDIIQKSENMFLFFPQGEIKSIYTNKFEFEKGALSYVFKKAKNDFQFVFNVNLIDYSAFRRPEISVYYKTYFFNKQASPEDVEKDFNTYAQTCIEKQRSE
jgi:hypothetical protein